MDYMLARQILSYLQAVIGLSRAGTYLPPSDLKTLSCVLWIGERSRESVVRA